MIGTKLKKFEFRRLSLGVKFRYNEDDDVVWVKIGSNSIAKWEEGRCVDWLGQTVACFSDDYVHGIIEEDVYIMEDLLVGPKKGPSKEGPNLEFSSTTGVFDTSQAPCSSCGNTNFHRTGTCYVCMTCGTSQGCS
jgi:hypothetical protein